MNKRLAQLAHDEPVDGDTRDLDRSMADAASVAGADVSGVELVTIRIRQLRQLHLAAHDELRSVGTAVRKRGHAFLLVAATTMLMLGVVGFWKLHRSIREQEQSNAQLAARSRELLRQELALDEHAIVAITDPSGKITYANDKFCEISKYSRAELIGQDHRIVNSGHHPRTFFGDMWRTITAGNTWHGDVCNRAKDGSVYWVDTTIVPFTDEAGRITQHVAIRADITERKRTEEQRETLIHDMGERVKELTCMYGVAECIRKRPTLEELFIKVAVSIPHGWHYPAITRGKVRFDNREYVSEPFEETEWKQSSDIVVNGRCRGAIEVYYIELSPELDEGPFMKEERSLIDSMAHAVSSAIENKLADDATREAKVEAEAAKGAKSDFLANMSHEIRTPMTAILGFAENLVDSDQSESEKLHCIHTIRRNGEALLGIINDILDLSRIEAGKIGADRVSCEPCSIIAEVASLMRMQAEAKGLPLNIEYEGAIPKTIHTDPARLRQILINLIGNAIKFTETGGVRLVTRCIDDAAEDQGGTPKEPYLQFDVIDTGRGIAEEVKEGLFQPFMQVDTSATRQIGGTGLGLTISKRFAELLGGDIVVVETELGAGSTFRATVATGSLDGVKMHEDPLSATVLAEDANAVAQAPRTDLHGLRILLAEDGPDNQRLISFFLKKAGADVTVEENGKLALAACRTWVHLLDVPLRRGCRGAAGPGSAGGWMIGARRRLVVWNGIGGKCGGAEPSPGMAQAVLRENSRLKL